MAITPTEGRNIAHFARKILAEKLIMSRRMWESMRDNKQHPDVVELGARNMESYRSLMLDINSIDLLDTDASNITVDAVQMLDSQLHLVLSMTRYLLTELEVSHWHDLINHLGNVIVQWRYSLNGGTENDVDLDDEVKVVIGALDLNPVYVTLLLMSDLHHLTFVASADQCLEILSST
jgi:hypothetical protein